MSDAYRDPRDALPEFESRPIDGHSSASRACLSRLSGYRRAWVVPALLRSAPIEGGVLEPAAGPFPDDGSPTRKRASSQRSDALWADPSTKQ